MPKKLMLVDGNSIINRAFYALPPLSGPDGEPTNGVHGFFSILLKFLDEEKPDYLVAAFDLKGKTFRHLMYDEYKAGRKPMPDDLRPQIPMARHLLELMNVRVETLEGYEADDILGTLAAKAEASGLEAVVVTGDKDLLQTASELDTVRIPKTKGGRTEVETYTPADVLEKIGVTPKESIDVKALMGDSSDNIPGIPGIGEKTAVKLIQEYKTLDACI
ncbi:MAG: DNA polymerase I, partial [Clostridiales bacterium]|nr:DNA polymerase I [Clostridiales bacterium]